MQTFVHRKAQYTVTPSVTDRDFVLVKPEIIDIKAGASVQTL